MAKSYVNYGCKSTRAIYCSWRIACAIAALFAVSLLGLADPVQAGCGDYVFFRDASGRLTRPSGNMEVHFTGSHQLPGQGDSPPLRLPCTGPGCSQRPISPVAPFPAPTELRTPAKNAALPNIIRDDSVLPTFRDRLAATRLMELHISPFIFRPPRSQAILRTLLGAR